MLYIYYIIYNDSKGTLYLAPFWLKCIICYGMLTSDTLDSTNPYTKCFIHLLANAYLWQLGLTLRVEAGSPPDRQVLLHEEQNISTVFISNW